MFVPSPPMASLSSLRCVSDKDTYVYQIKHITTGSWAPPSAGQMCSVISVERRGPCRATSSGQYPWRILSAGIVSLRTPFFSPPPLHSTHIFFACIFSPVYLAFYYLFIYALPPLSKDIL